MIGDKIPMQDKIKILIIIVLVGLLAMSAFAILQANSARKAVEQERNTLKNENESLYSKVGQITKERKELQEKVNVLTSDLDKAFQEKQDIRKQYDSLVQERDSLVEKAKSLKKDNEQLQNDLAGLKSEKQKLDQSLEASLVPLKQENAQLKQQLDTFNGLKGKLDSELAQLKSEKSDLEQKLNGIDALLQQKLTRIRYLSLKDDLDALHSGGTKAETQVIPQGERTEKESVELPPIVVRPKEESTFVDAASTIQKSTFTKPTGTVLDINKDNKFVIIDLGQDVGTEVGNTFKVYKHGEPVADIKVIQARQSISACDIIEETKPIAAGDIVR